MKHTVDGHSANFTSDLFLFPLVPLHLLGYQKAAGISVAPVFVGVDLRTIMRHRGNESGVKMALRVEGVKEQLETVKQGCRRTGRTESTVKNKQSCLWKMVFFKNSLCL